MTDLPDAQFDETLDDMQEEWTKSIWKQVNGHIKYLEVFQKAYIKMGPLVDSFILAKLVKLAVSDCPTITMHDVLCLRSDIIFALIKMDCINEINKMGPRDMHRTDESIFERSDADSGL